MKDFLEWINEHKADADKYEAMRRCLRNSEDYSTLTDYSGIEDSTIYI